MEELKGREVQNRTEDQYWGVQSCMIAPIDADIKWYSNYAEQPNSLWQISVYTCLTAF